MCFRPLSFRQHFAFAGSHIRRLVLNKRIDDEAEGHAYDDAYDHVQHIAPRHEFLELFERWFPTFLTSRKSCNPLIAASAIAQIANSLK